MAYWLEIKLSLQSLSYTVLVLVDNSFMAFAENLLVVIWYPYGNLHFVVSDRLTVVYNN